MTVGHEVSPAEGPLATAVTQPANAVLKAFEVLELFRDSSYVTPSECTSRLGMPRTTAHRMLVTLRHAGMLEVTPDGRYSMAMSMFELGSWTPLVRRLNDVATGHLQLLRDRTGMIVHLAVRDGMSIVYLQNAHRGVVRLPSGVGSRGPMHATGLGKALLAAMPEAEAQAVVGQTVKSFTPRTHRSWESLADSLETTRATGFAYDIEERRMGVCCLATAVRNGQGEAIAAISIAAPADRFRDRMRDFRAPLATTATAVARDLVRRRLNVAS